MNAVTFDTLKYADKLEAAGIPREQAKMHASALSEVLEVNMKELATKGDLAMLEARMEARTEQLRAEIERTKAELIKWNIGAIIAAAGLAMAIARLFFHP
jgi:uncharacterized small protein (DUF1192 family)